MPPPVTDDCFKQIVPNITIYSHQIEESIAIIDSVNEDNYQAVKTSVVAKTTVFVPPVAAAFDGDYNQFKQRRDQLKRDYSYNRDLRESEVLFISVIPEDARVKFVECKRIVAEANSQGFGINAELQNVTDTTIALRLSWYMPQGRPGTIEAIYVSGAENDEGLVKGYEFQIGHRGCIFRRTPGKDFILSITVSGTMDYVHVPTINPGEWVSLNARVLKNQKYQVGFHHLVSILDVSSEPSDPGAEVYFYNRQSGAEITRLRIPVHHGGSLFEVEGQRYHIAVQDVTTYGRGAAELRINRPA